MIGLDGKVAIVTGGATGLGRTIVQRYADFGAKVVIADLRPEEGERAVAEIVAGGGEALFVMTDVTSSEDVLRAVAAAEERFGGLHIMTANAGVMGRSYRKSIVDVPEEDLQFVMDVNFLGVWNSFKHAIPAIRRSGGDGAMTATASTAATQGMGGLPAYSASKAAVIGLVRSVAADVGPAIRVNAVTAGAMDTTLPAHTAELMGLDASTLRASSPAASEVVDPDYVARVHLFLVSDLSVHVNGQAILADAGRSNLPA